MLGTNSLASDEVPLSKGQTNIQINQLKSANRIQSILFIYVLVNLENDVF